MSTLDEFFDTPKHPEVPPQAFDVESLKDGVVAALQAELGTLLPELQGAVSGLVNEIAPALVSAAATGDKQLTEELKAGIALAADIQQVQLSQSGLRILQSASNLVLGVLTGSLSSLLPDNQA